MNRTRNQRRTKPNFPKIEEQSTSLRVVVAQIYANLMKNCEPGDFISKSAIRNRVINFLKRMHQSVSSNLEKMRVCLNSGIIRSNSDCEQEDSGFFILDNAKNNSQKNCSTGFSIEKLIEHESFYVIESFSKILHSFMYSPQVSSDWTPSTKSKNGFLPYQNLVDMAGITSELSPRALFETLGGWSHLLLSINDNSFLFPPEKSCEHQSTARKNWHQHLCVTTITAVIRLITLHSSLVSSQTHNQDVLRWIFSLFWYPTEWMKELACNAVTAMLQCNIESFPSLVSRCYPGYLRQELKIEINNNSKHLYTENMICQEVLNETHPNKNDSTALSSEEQTSVLSPVSGRKLTQILSPSNTGRSGNWGKQLFSGKFPKSSKPLQLNRDYTSQIPLLTKIDKQKQSILTATSIDSSKLDVDSISLRYFDAICFFIKSQKMQNISDIIFPQILHVLIFHLSSDRECSRKLAFSALCHVTSTTQTILPGMPLGSFMLGHLADAHSGIQLAVANSLSHTFKHMAAGVVTEGLLRLSQVDTVGKFSILRFLGPWMRKIQLRTCSSTPLSTYYTKTATEQCNSSREQKDSRYELGNVQEDSWCKGLNKRRGSIVLPIGEVGLTNADSSQKNESNAQNIDENICSDGKLGNPFDYQDKTKSCPSENASNQNKDLNLVNSHQDDGNKDEDIHRPREGSVSMFEQVSVETLLDTLFDTTAVLGPRFPDVISQLWQALLWSVVDQDKRNKDACDASTASFSQENKLNHSVSHLEAIVECLLRRVWKRCRDWLSCAEVTDRNLKTEQIKELQNMDFQHNLECHLNRNHGWCDQKEWNDRLSSSATLETARKILWFLTHPIGCLSSATQMEDINPATNPTLTRPVVMGTSIKLLQALLYHTSIEQVPGVLLPVLVKDEVDCKQCDHNELLNVRSTQSHFQGSIGHTGERVDLESAKLNISCFRPIDIALLLIPSIALDFRDDEDDAAWLPMLLHAITLRSTHVIQIIRSSCRDSLVSVCSWLQERNSSYQGNTHTTQRIFTFENLCDVCTSMRYKLPQSWMQEQKNSVAIDETQQSKKGGKEGKDCIDVTESLVLAISSLPFIAITIRDLWCKQAMIWAKALSEYAHRRTGRSDPELTCYSTNPSSAIHPNKRTKDCSGWRLTYDSILQATDNVLRIWTLHVAACSASKCFDVARALQPKCNSLDCLGIIKHVHMWLSTHVDKVRSSIVNPSRFHTSLQESCPLSPTASQTQAKPHPLSTQLNKNTKLGIALRDRLLRSMVDLCVSMLKNASPNQVLLVSELVWVAYSLMSLQYAPLFPASVHLLRSVLEKMDLNKSQVHQILLATCPIFRNEVGDIFTDLKKILNNQTSTIAPKIQKQETKEIGAHTVPITRQKYQSQDFPGFLTLLLSGLHLGKQASSAVLGFLADALLLPESCNWLLLGGQKTNLVRTIGSVAVCSEQEPNNKLKHAVVIGTLIPFIAASVKYMHTNDNTLKTQYTNGYKFNESIPHSPLQTKKVQEMLQSTPYPWPLLSIDDQNTNKHKISANPLPATFVHARVIDKSSCASSLSTRRENRIDKVHAVHLQEQKDFVDSRILSLRLSCILSRTEWNGLSHTLQALVYSDCPPQTIVSSLGASLAQSQSETLFTFVIPLFFQIIRANSQSFITTVKLTDVILDILWVLSQNSMPTGFSSDIAISLASLTETIIAIKEIKHDAHQSTKPYQDTMPCVFVLKGEKSFVMRYSDKDIAATNHPLLKTAFLTKLILRCQATSYRYASFITKKESNDSNLSLNSNRFSRRPSLSGLSLFFSPRDNSVEKNQKDCNAHAVIEPPEILVHKRERKELPDILKDTESISPNIESFCHEQRNELVDDISEYSSVVVVDDGSGVRLY